MAQMVKSLPAMWETRVWSLGREDPLEKEMATLSSILAWKIPWMVKPGQLQSLGSQRVSHDWATSLSLCVFLPPLLNMFCFCYVHTILSFIVPIFAWNIFLVSLDFLEESFSVSYCIVFLYFALITEEGFLLSPCYSLELCIQMGISFLFLLCL